MSACFRTNTGTRTCWKPTVFPSGSHLKNSLAEYFGYSSKFDAAQLIDEGNIIVHEEFVDSNRFALWAIASSLVPVSEQVPLFSGRDPSVIPGLVQYLFEDGWGERYLDEFIPEHCLQKLRFELNIEAHLVPDEANRHKAAGFWIGVIFQMTEYLLRPYSPHYNPRWVICSLSDPTTTSYHVILSNYYFSNSRVCMELTRLVKEVVADELFQKMLNDAVCKPDCCFRILNCSKWGSGQIKRLVVKETFPQLDYTLPAEIYRQGVVKPIHHFMDELAATLITYTTGCDHIAYPA